jgi:Tfp pilus assembly protein PilF
MSITRESIHRSSGVLMVLLCCLFAAVYIGKQSFAEYDDLAAQFSDVVLSTSLDEEALEAGSVSVVTPKTKKQTMLYLTGTWKSPLSCKDVIGDMTVFYSRKSEYCEANPRTCYNRTVEGYSCNFHTYGEDACSGDSDHTSSFLCKVPVSHLVNVTASGPFERDSWVASVSLRALDGTTMTTEQVFFDMGGAAEIEIDPNQQPRFIRDVSESEHPVDFVLSGTSAEQLFEHIDAVYERIEIFDGLVTEELFEQTTEAEANVLAQMKRVSDIAGNFDATYAYGSQLREGVRLIKSYTDALSNISRWYANPPTTTPSSTAARADLDTRLQDAYTSLDTFFNDVIAPSTPLPAQVTDTTFASSSTVLERVQEVQEAMQSAAALAEDTLYLSQDYIKAADAVVKAIRELQPSLQKNFALYDPYRNWVAQVQSAQSELRKAQVAVSKAVGLPAQEGGIDIAQFQSNHAALVQELAQDDVTTLLEQASVLKPYIKLLTTHSSNWTFFVQPKVTSLVDAHQQFRVGVQELIPLFDTVRAIPPQHMQTDQIDLGTVSAITELPIINTGNLPTQDILFWAESYTCDVGIIPIDMIRYSLDPTIPYEEMIPLTREPTQVPLYVERTAGNGFEPGTASLYMRLQMPHKGLAGTCSGKIHVALPDEKEAWYELREHQGQQMLVQILFPEEETTIQTAKTPSVCFFDECNDTEGEVVSSTVGNKE